MRANFLSLLLLACLGLVQGKDDRPVVPSGHITVFVHWGDQGVPGHRVDLVETGQSRTTDARGIARFEVRPGSYTVRVYDLNRGGPSLLTTDFPASVKRGQTVLVDAVDCLPCV